MVLHYGDLTRLVQPSPASCSRCSPAAAYLGAQSHVAVRLPVPEPPADVDAMGTLRLLEAIRLLGLDKKTGLHLHLRLYGLVQEIPKETTPSTRAAPTRWPSSTPTGSR